MIPYEELVEALDRYVARNGGTPQSARVPASAAPRSAPSSLPPSPAPSAFAPPPPVAPSEYEPPTHDVHLPSGAFDEMHDPDLPPLAGQHEEGGDATHVGAMPGGGAMPPPLAPVTDDHSNEIDIHDVLDEDEI